MNAVVTAVVNASAHAGGLLVPPPDACGAARVARTTLLESGVGLVEDVRCISAQPRTVAADLSRPLQVWLPYRGLFVWHVGNDRIVADANQVLFVLGGEAYSLSQPRVEEYRTLIVTPGPVLLHELDGMSETALRFHPLLRRRNIRAACHLQFRLAQFLRQARGERNILASEQLIIDLLRCAFESDCPRWNSSPSTIRLVARAKEYLHANLANPIHLVDVARATGGSAAYLTDAFRRVEGVPLHRYLTQLRLARALVDLPHAADLTTLALALGFSSHSHFSSAFRRAFGCTPSRFRGMAQH